MRTATSPRTAQRVLALTAAAFFVLSGLAFALRAPLYESLAGAASDEPDLHGPVDFIASKGILALLAITAIVAIIAWRRGRESFILLVSAGVGTITAYLASEIIKLVIAQARPCTEIAVETILACPAAGDWSWPSNHATIAAALATSCILIVPRIWLLAAPIALVIALSRVLAGVHYPHDVMAGIALGIAVTLIVTVLVNRILTHVFAATSRRNSARA